MADIKVACKEFFPRSHEEGWGDLTMAIRITGDCHFNSLNNCGLTCIQNVSGGAIASSRFITPDALPAGIREKYRDPHWGSWLSDEVPDAFNKFCNSLNERYQDEIFNEVYAKIEKTTKLNCYVLTAPVNLHHPTRTGGTGGAYAKYDKYYPTTDWFARQLIARKKGYVVQSPVSVNTIHASPTDFSLIRVWVWYPDWAVAFKPAKYLGYGKLMTREQVIEKVKTSRNFSTAKLSKYTVEDYVDGYK